MADNREAFLKNWRCEIVNRTTSPIALADALLSGHFITDELYNKIKAQATEENKMREIYKGLNSEKHFNFTYDWLKKNEIYLIEELEIKDTEAAALQTGDETDNRTGSLDLKEISTFPKLEKWVTENSQKLISDLENKIGEEQMKVLENELRNKKLKKTNLFFSNTNIDDIQKNRDLDGSKFPKLTLRMFFEHISSDDTRGTNLNENKYNKDVQDTQKDETDGQTEPPGQPPNVSPKSPNQPINERMMENVNVQEPFSSQLLQKNSPASESDNMSSNGSWDTQQNSKAETTEQNKDTEMPAQVNMQHPVQTNQPSTSRANKAKKNIDRNNLLHDWAEKQCNGSKEEVKKILDQISFIHKAEHRDYPFFTAENVILFNKLTTHERQIIHIKDKITTRVQYHMFVCGVKTAIVLEPEEKETTTELKEQIITYEENYLRINKCLKFISEAFAPALAVYKKVQKEQLYSLI